MSFAAEAFLNDVVQTGRSCLCRGRPEWTLGLGPQRPTAYLASRVWAGCVALLQGRWAKIPVSERAGTNRRKPILHLQIPLLGSAPASDSLRACRRLGASD